MFRLTAVFLSSLILACGPSPLFNHEEAAAERPPQTVNPEKPTCDINLDPFVCAYVTWTQGPFVSQESIFELRTTESGQAISYENMKVVLWMPSMGHGSAPVRIIKLSEGQYRVDKIYFLMKGQWELRFFDGDRYLGVLAVEI